MLCSEREALTANFFLIIHFATVHKIKKLFLLVLSYSFRGGLIGIFSQLSYCTVRQRQTASWQMHIGEISSVWDPLDAQ